MTPLGDEDHRLVVTGSGFEFAADGTALAGTVDTIAMPYGERTLLWLGGIVLPLTQLFGTGFLNTAVDDVFAGDDTVFGASWGAEINAGEGVDIVSFDILPGERDRGVGVNYNMSHGKSATNRGDVGLVGVEGIAGTPYADRLWDNAGDNLLIGGGGDDELHAS